MYLQQNQPPNNQFYQYNQVPSHNQVILNNQYPINQNFGNLNYPQNISNQPIPIPIGQQIQNQNFALQGLQYQNFGNGMQNQMNYPYQNPQSLQIFNNTNQILTPNDLMNAENIFWGIITQQLIFFIFLKLACIIIQYVCCGSKKAAQLWIVCLVFMTVSMALIKYTGRIKKIQILYISYLLFGISIIFDIAAFAIAVQNPPILIIYIEDQKYTQNVGDCLLYSDDVAVQFQKYSGGMQFGFLALYIFQFLHSLLTLYLFLQKGSSFMQSLKQTLNFPQQIVPIR